MTIYTILAWNPLYAPLRAWEKKLDDKITFSLAFRIEMTCYQRVEAGFVNNCHVLVLATVVKRDISFDTTSFPKINFRLCCEMFWIRCKSVTTRGILSKKVWIFYELCWQLLADVLYSGTDVAQNTVSKPNKLQLTIFTALKYWLVLWRCHKAQAEQSPKKRFRLCWSNMG